MMNTPDHKLQAFDAVANLAHAVDRDFEAMKETSRQIQAATQSLTNLANRLETTVRSSTAEAVAKEAKKVFEQHNDTADAATRAQDAYERAGQWALSKVAIVAAATVVAVAAAVVGIVWLVTPAPNEIQALRDEKAQLEAVIAQLREMGGDTELTSCDGRPCVRLNPQTINTPYTSGAAQYRILYGH